MAAAGLAARLLAARDAADSVSWTPATIPAHVSHALQSELDAGGGGSPKEGPVLGTATHQLIPKASTTPSAQWLYCVCLVPATSDPPSDHGIAVAAPAGDYSCQASFLEDCQAAELTSQQQAALQRVPWDAFGLSLSAISSTSEAGALLRFQPSASPLPFTALVCCKFLLLPSSAAGTDGSPAGLDEDASEGGTQQLTQRRRRPRKPPVLGVKVEAGCLVRATTMALQLLRMQLSGAQLRSRQQVALEASVGLIARSMAAIISSSTNPHLQQYACTLLGCPASELRTNLATRMAAAGAAELQRSLPAAAAAAFADAEAAALAAAAQAAGGGAAASELGLPGTFGSWQATASLEGEPGQPTQEMGAAPAAAAAAAEAGGCHVGVAGVSSTRAAAAAPAARLDAGAAPSWTHGGVGPTEAAASHSPAGGLGEGGSTAAACFPAGPWAGSLVVHMGVGRDLPDEEQAGAAVDSGGLLLLRQLPEQAMIEQQQQQLQVMQMQPLTLLQQPQPSSALEEAAGTAAGTPSGPGPSYSSQAEQQHVAVRPRTKRRLPPINLLQHVMPECTTRAATLPARQQQAQQLMLQLQQEHQAFSLPGPPFVAGAGWSFAPPEAGLKEPLAAVTQVQQQPQLGDSQPQVGWWSTAQGSAGEVVAPHGLYSGIVPCQKRRSSGRRSISGSAAASMF